MEYEALFNSWLSLNNQNNESSDYTETYNDGNETVRYTDTDD